MKSPAKSSCKNRLPNIQRVEDVPLDSSGGASGAMYHLLLTSHSPTSGSSAWWAGPGVAAASHFFIIASRSGAPGWSFPFLSLAAGLSWLKTLPTSSAALTARTADNGRLSFMVYPFFEGSPELLRHRLAFGKSGQLPLTSQASR